MAGSTRTLDTLISGHAYLEGPRWHDGRLWASDFYTRQVVSVGLDGDEEIVLALDGQPSGLGWLPDGRLLVVSMLDRRVMVVADGEASVHADLSDIAPFTINDMVVDEEGGAYVSCFAGEVLHGDPITPTVIIRVEPNGSARAVADGIHFPNGMVITKDNVLAVAETLGNRITAFDIAANGDLSNQRPWAQYGERPTTTDMMEAVPQLTYSPDGMATDAEGAIWFADGFGKRAIRMAEGGEVLDEISTEPLGFGTFAVALGGPEGTTLFLCSGVHLPSEEQCLADKQSRILTTTVDVPHAGRP
jgi:sugar lactone lactonase YvrE